MNKTEFIDYIADKNSITKHEAEKVINTFVASTTSALGEGQDISLIGFGKFYTTQVEARTGRNPKTGAALQIDAYTQPKFSAGSSLKSACNTSKKK